MCDSQTMNHVKGKLNDKMLLTCSLIRNISAHRHVIKFCSFKAVQLRKMSDTGAKKPKIDVEPNTIGTHSGTFHCDEILAVYLLGQLPEFQNHKLLRTREQELLEQCDIVVDVGSVFDPAKKRYDHHQKTFNESFSSLRPELGPNGTIR